MNVRDGAASDATRSGMGSSLSQDTLSAVCGEFEVWTGLVMLCFIYVVKTPIGPVSF